MFINYFFKLNFVYRKKKYKIIFWININWILFGKYNIWYNFIMFYNNKSIKNVYNNFFYKGFWIKKDIYY